MPATAARMQLSSEKCTSFRTFAFNGAIVFTMQCPGATFPGGGAGRNPLLCLLPVQSCVVAKNLIDKFIPHTIWVRQKQTELVQTCKRHITTRDHHDEGISCNKVRDNKKKKLTMFCKKSNGVFGAL